MLQSLENHRTKAIRERLDQAHCVFDFVVLTVAPTACPGEAEHRMALQLLFDGILAREKQLRAKVTEGRRKYERKIHQPDLSPDLKSARAEPLDESARKSLGSLDGPLFRAFKHPPYGADVNETDFREWLQVLRLYPDEEMVVLDWVGDFQDDPQRSAWSRYFNAGKEWWGIWCLTLYNPRRQTLSALAASATD